jgi:hypothetical protein
MGITEKRLLGKLLGPLGRQKLDNVLLWNVLHQVLVDMWHMCDVCSALYGQPSMPSL